MGLGFGFGFGFGIRVGVGVGVRVRARARVRGRGRGRGSKHALEQLGRAKSAAPLVGCLPPPSLRKGAPPRPRSTLGRVRGW